MWTDVSTVVLGIAIIFFAFMQWYEMHGSGKQTDRLIATATAIESHQKQLVEDNKTNLTQNKAAIEATLKENRDEVTKLLAENQKALEANRKQGQSALDASVNASRLDQRAWIGFRQADFHLAADAPLAVTVHSINTGKTPALNVRSHIELQTVPIGLPVPAINLDSPSHWGLKSITVCDPSQEHTTPIKADAPPDPIVFKAIKDGHMRLYVRIRFTYDDVFAKPLHRVGAHRSEHCWIYVVPADDLEDCDFGNYAD